MVEDPKNIQLGNAGNIDWNKLKPGLKKENIAAEFNTIWDKIDTSKDGEINQAEIDAFKNDLTQAIEDEVITCDEAKAFLESKGINNANEDNLFQFILQLGNIETENNESTAPKASDFGFVDGKLENIEIDARAAGIAKEVYTGSVRIPEGQTMPEDDSLPTVLLMDLPDSYGENATSKLTYNKADDTYMSRLKDMAFKLEQDEDGNVTFKAVDNEQLKLKRNNNLIMIRKILRAENLKAKREEIKRRSHTLDNQYDDSSQICQGDCYLMAAINSIRNLPNGQELLQKLRTEEVIAGKKVYTITLPGAVLAKLCLDDKTFKNGVFITGEYTFTEDEVQDIVVHDGTRYSRGDGDTILLEAAFEKYREEVRQTLDANGIPRTSGAGIAGMYGGKVEDNPLRGGYPEDAIFILTGYLSDHYIIPHKFETPTLSTKEICNNNAVPYKSARSLSTFITTAVRYKYTENTNVDKNYPGIREIRENEKTSINDLDKMLNEIQEDFESDNQLNKIVTAVFKLEDSSGEGGHAFTVKRVSSDEVILINPWDPDKELKMPREMFLEYAEQVAIADNSDYVEFINKINKLLDSNVFVKGIRNMFIKLTSEQNSSNT